MMFMRIVGPLIARSSINDQCVNTHWYYNLAIAYQACSLTIIIAAVMSITY